MRLNTDGGTRVFPKQDVVFEIDRSAGKLDGEDGNEFAVEMVSDAGEGFCLGAGGFQDGGVGHGGLLVWYLCLRLFPGQMRGRYNS